ncbi:hypothetical protein INT50_08905 [Vibrio diabolicus]|uniref:hypothetical protein n=1 Tax=Vibrio diabolicus TaxID=50719 RepID=UPI0013DF16C8|nr:hypothetical protein [Vibrio diabolicus]QOV28701.1 hypothetical protein INT50_08340 [Vibrio diabolicus]QOV28803.1 hypothetical protein INT50_08905 [Vibrio diabolicus]
MSVDWANRQRDTNKLVRRIAKYIFSKESISAEQLYGLSKLSWITNSYEGENASYISSTKIPALAAIFNRDYKKVSIDEVAKDVADILQDSNITVEISKHTGFTNFYKAYRNSAYVWIEDNFDILLPMYKSAFLAKNSEDRKRIITQIANTPGIPKANHPEQLMKPEYFLTPTFFMLDAEIKFPLINGNEWVKNLLKKLEVQGKSLPDQYDAMIKLYGVGGIIDAADLDQVGRDIPDFISIPGKKAKKKLLEKKDTKNTAELPLKDETDVKVIKHSGTIKQRRIHNQLTNKVLNSLSSFTLLEGCDDSCMFDVLVKDYDGDENDLIIEVKSSIERSNIRMAIGQLFDYLYELKGDDEPHIAILLPEKPDNKAIQLLNWMDIGMLWFEGDNIHTSSDWLEPIATVS